MSEKWFFVIPDLNPEPWTAPAVSIGRKGGKVFPQFYSNEQMKNYKAAVTFEIDKQLPEFFTPIEGPVKLTFYFKRRLDEYKSPQARASRKHEADATNLQKATEDAIQGVLIKNDKDVVGVESWILEQGHDTDPGVAILLETEPSTPTIDFGPGLSEKDETDEHSQARIELTEEIFG